MTGALGVFSTKHAISSGGCIVMLPLKNNVRLLALVQKERRFTCIAILVISQTCIWIAAFFLQHLFGRLDVRGWAELL